MISIEKLNASAKAIACQTDCSLKKETIIIIKQKRLTITVSAFFSDKYFFMYQETYEDYFWLAKISWLNFRFYNTSPNLVFLSANLCKGGVFIFIQVYCLAN